MFHMHLLIKQQRNQAFVLNSCPFSGYAGIDFFFYYMLHNFMLFHSYSIEQNMWPQEFYDANEKKRKNSKNKNICTYNHKINPINLKEFSQQQQNAYLYSKERK